MLEDCGNCEIAPIPVRLRLGRGCQEQTMVIPLVGRLKTAPGKEGLLRRSCRGNLHAKQAWQHHSKKMENSGLCDLKTEKISRQKTASIVVYERLTGTFDDPGEWSQQQKPVTLTWDARRVLSRKFLFRGLLLLRCPAFTVNSRLRFSVLFFRLSQKLKNE